MLNITDVRILKVEHDEKLRAFATIVLDGCFVVGDFRIVEGDEGYFISMPSRRKRDGSYKDNCFPLDQATRDALEERILMAYEEASGVKAISRIEKGLAEQVRPDLLSVEEFGFTPKPGN